MIVQNYQELNEVCESRGWNTKCYLDEIEQHLFANGGYAEDIPYYGEYYDCFYVVKPPIIEIEKDGEVLQIEETRENTAKYADWVYVQQVQEPIYKYIK